MGISTAKALPKSACIIKSWVPAFEGFNFGQSARSQALPMGSMGVPMSEGLKFSDAEKIIPISLNNVDKSTEK